MDFEEHIKNVLGTSDDTKKQVGCLIIDDNDNIISEGSNQLPLGLNKTDIRLSDDNKRDYILHSERNAIYKAARNGHSTLGCKMYVTYFPCHKCARAIIQSGIKEIITYKPDFEHHKWGESWKISLEMFDECGVNIKYLEDE